MKKLVILLLFIPLVSFGQDELEELTIHDWIRKDSGESIESFNNGSGESYVKEWINYTEKGGREKQRKLSKEQYIGNPRYISGKDGKTIKNWIIKSVEKTNYFQPYNSEYYYTLWEKEEIYYNGEISSERNFKGDYLNGKYMYPIYDGFTRIYGDIGICFEEFYIYHNLVYRSSFKCGGFNFVSSEDAKKVDEYDLKPMVNIFLDDYLNNYLEAGLPNGEKASTPSIFNEFKELFNIKATFVPLEGDALALAYGFNDDKNIILKVDPEKWAKASSAKRWYTIYHELGHDVLNLEHGEGGKMMYNFADID